MTEHRASRIVREGPLHWTVWVKDPDGEWTRLSSAFTRRGARRELRLLATAQ